MQEGGSDIGVAVYLTDAEAVAVYGVGAVAGWYLFSFTDATDMGEDTSGQLVRSEEGIVRKQYAQQPDFTLGTTLLQTDDETLALLDVLKKSAHKYRYAVPNDDGTHQVYGLYAGWVEDPTGRTTSQKGQNRSKQVNIRSSANPSHVVKTVADVTDQTSDGWDALTAFKDAVVV